VSFRLRAVAAAAHAFRRQKLCGSGGLPRQCTCDRHVVDVGFVLIELEAALDLINRHDQTHNGFLHSHPAAPPSRRDRA
jgi:hypothetical protein